jgi:hypothetical protein
MPFRPLRPGIGPGTFTRSGSGVGAGGGDTAPLVTFVTPNASDITGGVSITITGSNFHNSPLGVPPTVTVGGIAATAVVVVNSTTITATVPAHDAGLVDLVITNDLGQSATLADAFVYVSPVITSLSPNFGPLSGGTSVIITGANFTVGMAVTFGGVAATSTTFIDAGHYVAVTPNHAVGPVDVAVGSAIFRGAFFYTLLTRGEDIRRNPTVRIREVLNSSPNTCTFTVDGRSAPPQVSELIEITDFATVPVVLFAGVAQTVEQVFEGRPQNLAWHVTASDFTCWLNRRRPFGEYVAQSCTDVVLDLITRYAPWVTVTHVQTQLAPVTITFDGTADFATCLSTLAKLIGGGHWYLDYTKDLHFFHFVPTDLPTPLQPTSVIGAGPGTAITASVSSTAGSLSPGYYLFWSTFVYSNGMESALSPSSNPIVLSGHRLPQLDTIPIGAPVGALTVTKRKIYFTYYGTGVTALHGWIEIADNTTTSLTAAPTSFQGIPAIPYVSPPTGPPAGPAVSESGTSARDVIGVILADLYGPGGTISNYSFDPGRYAFKVTNVYADGTESLGSPASGTITLSGSKAVSITAAPGSPIAGVAVVYRKVYASKAVGSAGPDFALGRTLGWTLIPNNSGDPFLITPGISISATGSGMPPSIGSTVFIPNVDGPWLEDDIVPDDIVAGNTDFLHDPPITVMVDVTQVRNRVIVIGQPEAPPPAPDVLATSAGPNTDLYYAGAQGVMAIVGAPARGIPMNIHWVALYQAAASPTDIHGGLDTFFVNNGLTYNYVIANPYTALMDLPEGFYDSVVAPPGEPDPSLSDSGIPEVPVVRPRVQLDHLESQRAMGRIELDDNGNATDGIHEIVIDDPQLSTQTQLLNRAQAELELFAWPIVTVHYATRDRKSKPGRRVTIDLATPPISGTFVIQDVEIDQIKINTSDNPSPRYTVRASSVKFDLDDLLLLISDAVGGTSFINTNRLVPAAVAAAVGSIPPAPAAAVSPVLESAIVTFNEADIIAGTLKLCVAGLAGYTIIPLCLYFTDDFSTVAGGWNTSRNAICRYVSGSAVDLINSANTFFQNTATKNSGYAIGPAVIALAANNQSGIGVNVGPSGTNILLAVSPSGYTAEIKLLYYLAASTN